jgi:hypothetical protein
MLDEERRSLSGATIASESETEIPYTGAEPFLVGISPQYWAHVPLSIVDVQNLKLVNGINCYWSSGGNEQLVPLSKCLIVGTIVNATMRSDESMAYVMDDGTGLIDCVLWSNNASNDMYSLPCLMKEDSHAEESNIPFRLGDLVRVFGKINCLGKQANDRIIREIQASLMERVESPSSSSVLLGNSYSLDAEARHWMQCADFQLSAQKRPSDHNALRCLELLGPQIQSQVREKRHLPSADDSYGAWRVFGASCRCKKLEYIMSELLYCHCKAKVEPLDPQFVFRDALLKTLLALQASHQKKLVFTYRQIKDNQQLKDVARKQAIAAGNVDLFVDRLLLNTFRALRHDGIIYLMDSKSDLYLFITRDKVLEPYVRSELNKGGSKNFVRLQGAAFLSKAHNERLLYIKRCLKK